MTKATMHKWVETLNTKFQRPTTAWKRDNGKNVSRDGHLFLDEYSPGDGWTRYRLMEIVGEHGGQSYAATTSQAFTKAEMEAFLFGLFTGLNLVEKVNV